jgi:DUF4097 and DUF4098 domain-containing protein YvlB
MPPAPPPPGYDPRAQRRSLRDQARAQRAQFRAQREQMRYQMRSLRRGSLLGPILLIAVGVVFLLMETGRLDHQRFWGWYGHWWPLLLVAAGGVVLVEWAMDQFLLRNPQRPAYRRSVGSGVIFLLVLFAFMGAISNHMLGFPPGSRMFPGFHFDQDSMDRLFGDKHESDATMDLSFAAGDSLTIANPRGSVTVSGTSDDSTLHLAIHKEIYASSDADADAKAQRFNPDSKHQNSAWTVTMPSIDGASADLELTVPASTPVSVTTDHGDIHIASIKAPVFVTANHGDIELSAITGAATAHINNAGSSLSARSMDSGITIQGHAQDVTLSDIIGPVNLSGEFFGTTHLEHINGAVRFHTSRTDLQFVRLDGEIEISSSGISADQVMGPVVLNTSNRNVSLDRLAGDIAVTNKNGNIDLTAAPTLGVITLEDRNGNIDATLPEKAGFTVQASTTNGDTSNDFSLSSKENGDRESINGTVGAGGPAVRITTANGDISLHKGDVEPLPAVSPAAPKITLVPSKSGAKKP